MIKRIKHECVTCKRLYGRPVTQRMADLPTLRCQPDAGPFSSVGVDIFGPFYVTVGRSQVKRYGCIFSCFTSRAVHVEEIDGLSADAFINCLIRFISHRGHPQLDHNDVIRAARRRNIEWVFNPPLASHHGGLWERMIHTMRRVLFAILNSSTRLTYDVLTTVFCEAENIINSHPIIKCSDDANDLEPLTPNHLLVLKGNYSYPWANPNEWGKFVPTQMACCSVLCQHILEAMAKGIFARSSATPKMARCEARYSDWWHGITDWWQRPQGRVATRACEWGPFRKRRFGAICEAGHKVRPTCQTDHQSCLIGKYAFWFLNTVRRIWLFLCRYFEKNWLS